MSYFCPGNITTKLGDMQLSKSASGTADVILFFDDLFDSFNGRKGQGLTSLICATSTHVKFWQDAIQRLRRMEYVDKESHKSIRRNNPKCLKNWIWTVQGSMQLWKALENCGFSSLNMKHFNQDIVENFFNEVRDHGHRNNNPSPHQFNASFKTLLCRNLTSKKSLSSNCEENEEGTSLALSNVFRAGEINSLNEEDRNIEYCDPAIPDTKSTIIKLDSQKILSNIIKNTAALECPECAECLEGNRVLDEIKQKVELAEERFPHFCHVRKIKEKLIKIFSTEQYLINSIHCPALQEHLNEEIARHFITAWCKIVNNILSGTIEVQEETNFIFNSARRVSIRFHKK